MWLFSKYGFFSAVCTKENPEELKVRARDVDHLRELKKNFPMLAPFEISESPKADYRCRMIVPKAIWTKVCEALAEDIDYDNFKSGVAAHRGRDAYEHALHEIWSVMYGVQVRKYGQGIYAYQNRKHGVGVKSLVDGGLFEHEAESEHPETEVEVDLDVGDLVAKATAEPRCKCGHSESRHNTQNGDYECNVVGCSCANYSPVAPKRGNVRGGKKKAAK